MYRKGDKSLSVTQEIQSFLRKMKVHYHIQTFWPLIANLIHKSLAYSRTLYLLEGILVFPWLYK